MLTFSDRLIGALEESGLTKTDFAKLLGISYQAVTKALSGDSKGFSASNNQKAAKILRVAADWLATGEGQRVETGDRVNPLSLDEINLIELLRALPDEVKTEVSAAVEKVVTEYAARVTSLASRSGA